MIKTVGENFPPIEAAYEEEFGTVDLLVYETAKTLRLPAERLADDFLNDAHEGLRLMLKAVVNVSRVRQNDASAIKNLPAYLFQTYKRILLAELKKRNGHRRILSENFVETENSNDPEEDLNRKILINELRRRMDGWTREVFEFLCLEYTFEQLVPDYGSAANVIRAKYSKKLARLAREINAEIEAAEANLDDC